jgi:phosphoketolase
VLFAADHNSAAALIEGVFQTRGQIWAMVVPKQSDVADVLTLAEARRLLADGAIELSFAGHRASEAGIVLTALGAYQLPHVLAASARLAERDCPHRVVYMLEPGRFRAPRSDIEARHAAAPALVDALYPADADVRVFLTHTRPEPLLGVLGPLHTGRRTAALGYVAEGGTLDVEGLLFVNGCTWAHVLRALARIHDTEPARYLTEREREALEGRRHPAGVVIPLPRD